MPLSFASVKGTVVESDRKYSKVNCNATRKWFDLSISMERVCNKKQISTPYMNIV